MPGTTRRRTHIHQAWLFAAIVAAVLPASPGRFARAAPPHASTTYTYTAVPQVPSKALGTVQAGSLRWQCSTSRCVIRGPWPSPGVGACRALAQKVGRLRSYGRPGRMLDNAQLAACNKGLAAAPVAMRRLPYRVVRNDAMRLPVKTPVLSMNKTGTPASNAAGHTTGDRSHITTPVIRAVATGSGLASTTRPALRIDAPLIRAVATGDPLTPPARASVTIRTPTIRAAARGDLPSQ